MGKCFTDGIRFGKEIRMIYNVIAYTLIRAAFEKGLQKVLENPEREIRNLIDLGNDFSKGENQKHFFEMATAELEKDDSMYYKLAERAIRSTEPEVILDFGLNLGYNSWLHGTRMVHDTEEKKGFHVPWVLTFHLDGNATIRSDKITDVIRQGKKMGIYSYLFHLTEDYPHHNELFSIFEKEKDCAYFLFVPPSTITESRAVRLLEARTVFTAIALDEGDQCTRESAAALLREYNCLRGGFLHTENLTDPTQLEAADRLGLPFLCMMATENGKIKIPDNEPSGVIELRNELAKPVFPMDFLGDVVMIDRYISKKAVLAGIQNDGTLMVNNIDGESSDQVFNVCDTPLAEIFAQVMPMNGEAQEPQSPSSST